MGEIFFKDTATAEIYTLSLHDALPISVRQREPDEDQHRPEVLDGERDADLQPLDGEEVGGVRSEEHTSELQSRQSLVCRLLLEKKTMSSVTPSGISVAILRSDRHTSRL